MWKRKTKVIQSDIGIHAYFSIFNHIQTYSGIIRHIQVYSGIIQAYSEPCVTLAYSELWYIQNHRIFKTIGIFRALVYAKLWHIQNQRHIQNPGLFKTLGYSKPETYSVSCQLSTMNHFEKKLTVTIIFAISAFHALQFMK